MWSLNFFVSTLCLLFAQKVWGILLCQGSCSHTIVERPLADMPPKFIPMAFALEICTRLKFWDTSGSLIGQLFLLPPTGRRAPRVPLSELV